MKKIFKTIILSTSLIISVVSFAAMPTDLSTENNVKPSEHVEQMSKKKSSHHPQKLPNQSTDSNQSEHVVAPNVDSGS